MHVVVVCAMHFCSEIGNGNISHSLSPRIVFQRVTDDFEESESGACTEPVPSLPFRSRKRQEGGDMAESF